MPIRAIIFDLGGVLVRTENRSPREQLAAKLGMSYAELSAIIFDNESARLATLGEITSDDHWRRVREALKLSSEEFSLVPQEFWTGDRLDLDLVNYLRASRKRYKTALLSNAWDDLRDMIEIRWQIADAFDEIIISAEAGFAKPDPRIYQIALQRLGVAPIEAVFIDDFRQNIEAARDEGWHAIHFESPAQTLKDLEQLLDHK